MSDDTIVAANQPVMVANSFLIKAHRKMQVQSSKAHSRDLLELVSESSSGKLLYRRRVHNQMPLRNGAVSGSCFACT